MNYPPKPMRGWPNTSLHEQLINDPDWIAEPKKNGHRTYIFPTKNPLFLSRRGSKLSLSELGDLPKEVKALIGLKVVDAELVMHPVPFLWLFDLPQARGRLRERRSRLSDWCAKISERCPNLKMMPLLPKRTAYQDALLAGEEGVVWKKLSSLYVMQMSPENEISDWIKFKKPDTW